MRARGARTASRSSTGRAARGLAIEGERQLGAEEGGRDVIYRKKDERCGREEKAKGRGCGGKERRIRR